MWQERLRLAWLTRCRLQTLCRMLRPTIPSPLQVSMDDTPALPDRWAAGHDGGLWRLPRLPQRHPHRRTRKSLPLLRILQMPCLFAASGLRRVPQTPDLLQPTNPCNSSSPTQCVSLVRKDFSNVFVRVGAYNALTDEALRPVSTGWWTVCMQGHARSCCCGSCCCWSSRISAAVHMSAC